VNGEDKTKEQLIEELGKMRQQLTELEALGTERMHLEEVLRESEDKYRSLVKNIPDVTWTIDSRGNTTFISPNVEIVYGYTPEEIYKEGERLWFERIHPDDVEKVKEAYKTLFEKGMQFKKKGVSSIFGPIITLFNYFNESKIELTPFFDI